MLALEQNMSDCGDKVLRRDYEAMGVGPRCTGLEYL